jgi:hypothetical protein
MLITSILTETITINQAGISDKYQDLFIVKYIILSL